MMFEASFSLQNFEFSPVKFGPRSLRHLHPFRRGVGTAGLGCFGFLGFRVSGLGFRILDLGFLGFRVWGLGFRVFRILGFGCRV